MGVSNQARGTALLALGLVTIVIGKGMFDVYSSALERQQSRFDHWSEITTMEAEALARPLWDFNVEQVNAILASLARDPGFQHATVVGPNGAKVADQGAAPGADEPGTPPWTFDVPIVFQEGARREAVGTLRVSFSPRALLVALRRQLIASVLGTLAVALVTAVGVLGSFRLAIEKRRLQGEAAAARDAITVAKAAIEAERADTAAQQSAVMQTLATHLARLAAGDLTCQISTRFAADYDVLRIDFNAAVDQLRDMLGRIVANTKAIRSGTSAFAVTADEMNRRTEQQSVSLAQSAAALDELTAAVSSSAEAAQRAHKEAAKTKLEAASSSEIVRQAVAAMAAIEHSSQAIAEILTVINEVAAQTSLLALNASVEAARAGDAGRGFAVVASEVRSLAEQCAQASKAIRALITESTRQVGAGVRLVADTGQALARMSGQVTEFSNAVSEIAASAAEQAAGLAEINLAVNDIDQITEQNAVMMERSTLAFGALARETEELARLTCHFKTGDASAGAPAPAAAARPSLTSCA